VQIIVVLTSRWPSSLNGLDVVSVLEHPTQLSAVRRL
jgi:hypothetical protein